jgi:hypothetical protein
MALGRIVEVIVGPDGTGTIISNLDVEFRVEKTINVEQNTAEFTVFNAKETTRSQVLRKGNNIVLNLGYEDEATATVFVGNITEAVSERVQADWITKIRAVSIRSKSAPLKAISIALSYGPDATLSVIMEKIGATAGLVITGISNIAGITLPNGWVYVGTFLGALRYLKNILTPLGKGLYIDNNEILIYNLGTASRYKIVRLSYASGLLSVKDVSRAEDNKKRLQLESLIIPQMRLNGAVNLIGTPSQDGTYIVDSFKIQGNNFGGQFKMTTEVSA